MGAMPIIMASAVIKTGRKRVAPASSAAAIASLPSAICSRAKLTTRMLFAVATPMHMIAPVRAGTDRLVWVGNSIQTMPARAAGRADDDHERIEPALKIDDDQQVDQDDCDGQAEQQLRKALFMVPTWPRNVTVEPLGSSCADSSSDLLNVGGDAAEVATLRRGVDVRRAGRCNA